MAGCATTATHNAVPISAPSSEVVSSKAPVAIPSDPAKAIAAAKARMGRESARFSENKVNLIKYAGVIDAKTGDWEVTGADYVVRRIGTDVYVKMSGNRLTNAPASPATLAHLAAGGWARTRLPDHRETTIAFSDAFPWNLANPASLATGVTRTGERSFAGTYVYQQTKMPVGIHLDDQGHFDKITMGDTSTPDSIGVVTTFSDFGVRADITAPPAAEVVDDEPDLLLAVGLL